MDVFSLVASISLDDSGYTSGLENASKASFSFGEKIKNGFATAMTVGAAAVTAITTASVAMGAGLVKAAGDVAEYGDHIDKQAQKMNMSIQAYQEWDAIMQHSGTTIDAMQASMKTLANAVETENGAFERLGITQEQVASMNNEELFSATITALQNVENETERTYLAGQLLGKGATELGALLNTSAEDTEAMRQRVHELNGVMSDEAVKAAAAYQDSFQDMQTAFSGLSRGMVSDFLPSITTVMDGLTELFSGNTDGGIGMISDGVNQIAENISEALPRILEVGSQILLSLGEAIVENLPTLISAGTQAIIFLTTGILQNLPALAEAAVEIVSATGTAILENLPLILDTGTQLLDQFTTGIEESLPDMIDRLPQIIDDFLNFITENLPAILDEGVEIINSLVDGIVGAIPNMIKALPKIYLSWTMFWADNLPKIFRSGMDILTNLAAGIIGAIPYLVAEIPNIVIALVEGFAAMVGSYIGIGANIIEGIGQGVYEAGTRLITSVTDVVGDAVDAVKDFLGIHSPSRVFAGIGENMALGLGEGWEDEFSRVKRDITDGLDFGTANVDFASSGLGVSSAGIINSVSGGGLDGSVIQLTLNLMTPDGTKFATWLLPDLIKVAAAHGTPIANGQVG